MVLKVLRGFGDFQRFSKRFLEEEFLFKTVKKVLGSAEKLSEPFPLSPLPVSNSKHVSSQGRVHGVVKTLGRSKNIAALSAPSPGDDLRSKSAIRLRGQIVRSDSFWEIGCDFFAVTIRLRLRCVWR